MSYSAWKTLHDFMMSPQLAAKPMRVITLLSGGLDSATVLASMRNHSRLAIGFDYGQPHRIELQRAAEIAETEGVSFLTLSVPAISKVNDVVFAGRNAVLVSVAASYAAANGYDAVAIGCNYSDWERFPDCRPGFIKALGSAMEDGYGVKLLAPLLRMSKAQVVEVAKELGVPIDRTWSCYNPQPIEKPCGTCAACKVRDAALSHFSHSPFNWTK